MQLQGKSFDRKQSLLPVFMTIYIPGWSDVICPVLMNVQNKSYSIYLPVFVLLHLCCHIYKDNSDVAGILAVIAPYLCTFLHFLLIMCETKADNAILVYSEEYSKQSGPFRQSMYYQVF